MADLQAQVEELWERRSELAVADGDALPVAREAVDLLAAGKARVAEVDEDGNVVVNEWLKQAILIFFKCSAMQTMELRPFEYADKVPLKSGYEEAGVRVVPGASARWGSFLDRGAVMMPSYVNIGARVGANTMVDTWATVGSCAQIGANVHLSGDGPSGVHGRPRRPRLGQSPRAGDHRPSGIAVAASAVARRRARRREPRGALRGHRRGTASAPRRPHRHGAAERQRGGACRRRPALGPGVGRHEGRCGRDGGPGAHRRTPGDPGDVRLLRMRGGGRRVQR